MNVIHLLVLICFTQLFISPLCDAQDSVVEGSGEILRQTDKVPVIDDELITTRASTQRDLLPSHVQNSKSEDKVPVSGSIDNRETTSLDLVFIIVPAVVGAAVIAAVIIGVVAIRRRGYHDKVVL
ncbi:uncharacterized protein LOC125667048 isoform X2 [Ostrea edulis]|uniref:uncharacterized protein LOC125667048 isoform X2 n=1 Tax=Ostrea edulis TaxID=37623 RepID=UPI0020956DEC|nr:uncharacterized protein LOC125667048 isoform X2 [Ostrea edulis]